MPFLRLRELDWRRALAEVALIFIGITLALSGAYAYMKAKQVSSKPAAPTPSSSPFVKKRA